MTKPVMLKIRSRLVASHQIPVLSLQPEQFAHALHQTIAQAPALFQQAPVVLDISGQVQLTAHELAPLLELCRAQQLIPYALTSEQSDHKAIAAALNLAWVEFKVTAPRSRHQPALTTKVITTPVRSGQQIYAPQANLVIMNLVSAGAEVIADGYVHIFGPLRGKAIAGAKGDTTADIVCQKMSAELISIAGTYLVPEQGEDTMGGARCTFDQDSILIQYL